MIQKRKTFNIILLLAASLTLMFILSGCGAGDGSSANYTGNGSTSTYALTSAKLLEWDPPTTNEDGTPLTDLKGYKLYYGPSSGNYTGSIDVGDTTSVEIATIIDSIYDSLPTPGTVCFAVTAYDTLGNESAYSNEVCGDI